jgi:hypothetical protein
MKAAMLTSFSPEEVKIISDAYALALKTFEPGLIRPVAALRAPQPKLDVRHRQVAGQDPRRRSSLDAHIRNRHRLWSRPTSACFRGSWQGRCGGAFK